MENDGFFEGFKGLNLKTISGDTVPALDVWKEAVVVLRLFRRLG